MGAPGEAPRAGHPTQIDMEGRRETRAPQPPGPFHPLPGFHTLRVPPFPSHTNVFMGCQLMGARAQSLVAFHGHLLRCGNRPYGRPSQQPALPALSCIDRTRRNVRPENPRTVPNLN